jgi:hypothetical protein
VVTFTLWLYNRERKKMIPTEQEVVRPAPRRRCRGEDKTLDCTKTLIRPADLLSHMRLTIASKVLIWTKETQKYELILKFENIKNISRTSISLFLTYRLKNKVQSCPCPHH